MSLRATSSTLLSQINELEKIFKVWWIIGVDKNKLRTVADIGIIQGNNHQSKDMHYRGRWFQTGHTCYNKRFKKITPLSSRNFNEINCFQHFIKFDVNYKYISFLKV